MLTCFIFQSRTLTCAVLLVMVLLFFIFSFLLISKGWRFVVHSFILSKYSTHLTGCSSNIFWISISMYVCPSAYLIMPLAKVFLAAKFEYRLKSNCKWQKTLQALAGRLVLKMSLSRQCKDSQEKLLGFLLTGYRLWSTRYTTIKISMHPFDGRLSFQYMNENEKYAPRPIRSIIIK